MDPLTLDDFIAKERECGVMHGPFWQAKYLERAPEIVRRELALARRFPELVATRQGRDTDLNPSGVASASFTPVTSGSEITIFDTPANFSGVPPMDVSPGSAYLLCFGGIYSNRTTTSPASTWTPRWGTSTGGVALGASGAVYSGAALTNNPLYGEITVAFRSSGTTAAATGNGFVSRGTGASGVGTIMQPIGGTVATIDTTVAGGIFIGHTWSATNAANTLTVQWVFLKVLN